MENFPKRSCFYHPNPLYLHVYICVKIALPRILEDVSQNLVWQQNRLKEKTICLLLLKPIFLPKRRPFRCLSYGKDIQSLSTFLSISFLRKFSMPKLTLGWKDSDSLKRSKKILETKTDPEIRRIFFKKLK